MLSKVLGLIFGFFFDKIWPNLDLYLYPYLKSPKGLIIIDELITKAHKVNLANIIEVMRCFFNGNEPFPSEQE